MTDSIIMIRPLSFILLLSASTIVLGQPLYKWVEPDGSITFSVKPPAAGITFERVDAEKTAAAPSTLEATANQPVSTPSLKQALPENVQPEVPTQRVAPNLNDQTSARSGLQRSTSSESGVGTVLATAPASKESTNLPVSVSDNSGNTQNGRSLALEARTRKQRQCEDLQKRVVSLEGRLRSRLTPEDMDNTVVHMARYQRSYDQHCVQ